MNLIKKSRVTLTLSCLCFFYTLKFYHLAIDAYLKHQTVTIGFVPALGLRQDPLLFLTSLFYHAGFGHLFSNLVVLIIVGSVIEWTDGPKRLLGVALGSGLIGNFLTLIMLRSVQRGFVGFSGALTGMLVYFLLTVNQTPDGKPKNKSMTFCVWMAFLFYVLPLFIGFFDEMRGAEVQTSSVGHLLGGVGGLIIHDLCSKRPHRVKPSKTLSPVKKTPFKNRKAA